MSAQIFLIDGALAQQPRPRSAVVAQMAADLIRLDAVADENDAIRCLMERGIYSSFEVMTLVGHARQVAYQEQVVAKVMSQS